MSLPPGFLDELRTRSSLAQVAGRKLMWDQRKSNQGKGDMWAPCPFHQEKTASFHVDDRKGFYYCFGCHAKGDAISFVRETENVGFMEAVEILAREVGMPMPARDPKAQEKSDRRSQLAEVMEQAVQYYRLQLRAGPGGPAREYLAGRGLNDEAQDRWEIGFAPDVRQGVFRHLKDKGVDDQLIIDTGLCAKPDDGGAPYDRFRGRIIFPIRDSRGRAIALGGRAMDPNARAKYLNSPETMLFDKGRTLFNHGPAREAAGKGQPLVVAEGYMDVIALSEAGFGACVAPLGTAITENQLQMLWRIAPEPVITLDGDTAGQRAAMRLIDLALPLLEAGLSLRFSTMPQGMDPDDLLKAQGAGAMQKLIENARPMVSLLWEREVEGKVFDSPERKAALDKSLREAIKTIRDPSIRHHYGEEIKRMRWELFRAKSGQGTAFRSAGNRNAPPAPLPGTRNSPLAAGRMSDALREAVILATLLLHPGVVSSFETVLERLDLSDPERQRMLKAILRHAEPGQDLRAIVAEETGPDAVENLFATHHLSLIPSVRSPGDDEVATLCVAEELAKLDARLGVRREIEDAIEDISGLADEGLTWRLSQAAQARNRAVRSETEDKAEYQTAQNGSQLSREELKKRDEIFSAISFSKGKTPH